MENKDRSNGIRVRLNAGIALECRLKYGKVASSIFRFRSEMGKVAVKMKVKFTVNSVVSDGELRDH